MQRKERREGGGERREDESETSSGRRTCRERKETLREVTRAGRLKVRSEENVQVDGKTRTGPLPGPRPKGVGRLKHAKTLRLLTQHLKLGRGGKCHSRSLEKLDTD